MKRLLTDWSLMRFLRLLMAGIAAYNAAVFKDPFMGLIAVFFFIRFGPMSLVGASVYANELSNPILNNQ